MIRAMWSLLFVQAASPDKMIRLSNLWSKSQLWPVTSRSEKSKVCKAWLQRYEAIWNPTVLQGHLKSQKSVQFKVIKRISNTPSSWRFQPIGCSCKAESKGQQKNSTLQLRNSLSGSIQQHRILWREIGTVCRWIIGRIAFAQKRRY